MFWKEVSNAKGGKVGTWIKRRKVVDGAMRIRSEKLRECQYREEYARYLEWKRVNGMEKTMSSAYGSR